MQEGTHMDSRKINRMEVCYKSNLSWHNWELVREPHKYLNK